VRTQRGVGRPVLVPTAGVGGGEPGGAELLEVALCVCFAYAQLPRMPPAVRLTGQGEQQLGRIDRGDRALQKTAELVGKGGIFQACGPSDSANGGQPD
jgi:hypothetical protein